MRHLRIRQWAIVSSFLSLLALPLLVGIVHWPPDFPNTENRQLADRPALDLQLLDPFPKAYEAYYKDHFPLRFRMVNAYNRLHLYVLKESPIPSQAIIGQDGWYFMAGNELDAYLGENPLDAPTLDSIGQELEYRRQLLKALGTELYVMIAPSKNDIYTDKMPLFLAKATDGSWGEQLNTYLQQHSQVKVIDLFEPFQGMRDTVPLYFKLDHHWNEIGAFVAANCAIETIAQQFPSLKPNHPADYSLTIKPMHNGSITGMFGIGEVFSDINYLLQAKAPMRALEQHPAGYPPVEGFPYPWDYERVRLQTDTTLPDLLLISDSYGHHVFPFLAEAFGKSVKIFDSWQYKLNEPIAEQERAAVMILLLTEGNIRSLLRFGSLPWGQSETNAAGQEN